MWLAEGNGNDLLSIDPHLQRNYLINSVHIVSSCAIVEFALSVVQTLFLVVSMWSELENVHSSIDNLTDVRSMLLWVEMSQSLDDTSSKNACKHKDNVLSNSDWICDEFVSTSCSSL